MQLGRGRAKQQFTNRAVCVLSTQNRQSYRHTARFNEFNRQVEATCLCRQSTLVKCVVVNMLSKHLLSNQHAKARPPLADQVVDS